MIMMMYFLNISGTERIIINGGPLKFKLQIDDYEDTKNKDNCNKAISNLINKNKEIDIK
jgi:hypothetical protein